MQARSSEAKQIWRRFDTTYCTSTICATPGHSFLSVEGDDRVVAKQSAWCLFQLLATINFVQRGTRIHIQIGEMFFSHRE